MSEPLEHCSHPDLRYRPTGAGDLRAQCAADSVLSAAIEQLRPFITAGGDESETARTLSLRSVDVLSSSGILAMKVPAVLGGLEADLRTQSAIIEQLAYLDASIGWCVMVCSTAIGLVGAFLADAATEQIFNGGVPTASIVVQPSGRAIAVTGGYLVNGRWTFASGIKHAQWVVAGVATDARGARGSSENRMVVVPASSVIIDDDWRSLGLVATGSCSFSIADVFVPQAFSWQFPEGWPLRGGPLYRLRWPGFVSYEPGAFALGIARRALAEMTEEACDRLGHRSEPQSSLLECIGDAEVQVCAVRTLLEDVGTRVWAIVERGGVPAAHLQAELRAASTYATQVAIDVATAAFRAGGSAAVYQSSVVQRCLADIQAAAQHWLVRREALEQYGRCLIGSRRQRCGGGPGASSSLQR